MTTSFENLNAFNRTKATISDDVEHNFLNILSKNKNSITSNIDNTPIAFDYLSSTNTDFFLPHPEDHLHTEPQLFSVEQGELQPITSPFMVPGIYRKIDASSVNKNILTSQPSNVFFTKNEQHGRIVRLNDFHKLYLCEDKLVDELNCNGQPRKVLLLKEIEKSKEIKTTPKMETTKPKGNVLKKWDPLTKLAYNILKLSNSDHSVVINRNRNEILRTEKSTNQKTLYRFLDDEVLGVQPAELSHYNQQSSEEVPPQKAKLGRPRKRVAQVEDGIKIDKETQLPNIEQTKNAETMTTTLEKPSEPSPQKILSRFGRVIKTVKPSTRKRALEFEKNNSAEDIRDMIADLKDKDYSCKLKATRTADQSNQNPNTEEDPPPVPIATSSPTKRNVPPEAVCPTCKKIFLGRRMKRHFIDFPDHMKPATATTTQTTFSAIYEDMSLFRFLVSKLQKSTLNEDQRADLFLHELNDLVEQLQLRSSRLIRNTSGLHFVSGRTARVLGIPEGQYALDMLAIDAPPPEPEPTCLLNFDNNNLPVPSNNIRNLDYTAISLDDTLTDEAVQKLNLSAGGKLLPPSEESLLRAVDDLLPPSGITKLVVPPNLLNPPAGVTTTSASTVPHYDHASDNAVEAVTMKVSNTNRETPLKLSVDFFNSILIKNQNLDNS